MSRQDTLDLITEVDESILALAKEQCIKPVKVKTILEHLRSSLDYLAYDAYIKLSPEKTKFKNKIYFPYGKIEYINDFFSSKLNINLPSSSPLYSLFITIQPFHTSEDWLTILFSLTNEAKHRNPVSVREETDIGTININAGNLVVLRGLGKNVRIDIKNVHTTNGKYEDLSYHDGEFSVGGGDIKLDIMVTEDRKIKFGGNDYEVIPFLMMCARNLRNFINEAYDILD